MPRLVIIHDENPDWGYTTQPDPLCSVECDIDQNLNFWTTRERLKQRLLGLAFNDMLTTENEILLPFGARRRPIFESPKQIKPKPRIEATEFPVYSLLRKNFVR